jgi:tripartite-type tricarboxylate transporter receptor subunit TctC
MSGLLRNLSGLFLPFIKLGRFAPGKSQSGCPFKHSVVVWAALALTAAITAVCASPAMAAEMYPAKPVRIVVPAGPGSGDDFAARQIASKLSELLGQPFIVENRPGAGGMIGQTLVAKSPPDGYTLLLAGGSMAGARYVNANMGYDLLRDFTPISLIETAPFALVVNPSLPARNVKEFIALARSRPGKLTYGTIGAGQIPYWSMALFNSMAGIDTVEIQYKSGSDAVVDVIAGRIDYFFPPVVGALTSKDKLRVLAVTTIVRSEMLPEVPTMAEAGLPGYEMPAWRSIMGPAGMRPEVIDILNRAIAKSLAAADLRDRFAKAGSMPMASSPAELRKRYEDWMGIFGKIAKDIGVKPQ